MKESGSCKRAWTRRCLLAAFTMLLLCAQCGCSSDMPSDLTVETLYIEEGYVPKYTYSISVGYRKETGIVIFGMPFPFLYGYFVAITPDGALKPIKDIGRVIEYASLHDRKQAFRKQFEKGDASMDFPIETARLIDFLEFEQTNYALFVTSDSVRSDDKKEYSLFKCDSNWNVLCQVDFQMVRGGELRLFQEDVLRVKSYTNSIYVPDETIWFDSELQTLSKPQDIPVQRTLTEELLSEYLKQTNKEELIQLADAIDSILMNECVGDVFYCFLKQSGTSSTYVALELDLQGNLLLARRLRGDGAGIDQVKLKVADEEKDAYFDVVY